MARHYINDMRQRFGLEPADASRDAQIEAMVPIERLKLLCGWNLGDPHWATTILSWVQDAGYSVIAD